MDGWQQDDADIELATRLSLLDHNKEREKGDIHGPYEDDEDVDRAIEESLRSSQLQSSRRNSNRHLSNQIICDVCDRPLRRRIENEFWNQHICESHQWDGTPVCCCCGKHKVANAEYMGLSDMRNICSACFATSITNERQKQSILDNVTEFLRLKGLELKGYIPVFLVDTREMARHSRSGPIHPNEILWGLTMFNPHPPPGSYVQNVESLSRRGSKIVMEQKKYPLNHSTRITVLVLFGLPKVMTGAILAHELVHAWFRQQGVYHLQDQVEEGICQVIAHEWLDWFELTDEEASSSSTSSRNENAQFIRNLKQFFKIKVEIDSSRVYGEGFREAKWAIERWGPQSVINHIVNYGTLPR